MMVYYIIGALTALWSAHGIYRHISRRNKTVCVDANRCTGCGKCLKICRHKVLKAVKEEKGMHIVVQNPDRCTACGNCTSACRFHALELTGKRRV